MLLRGRLVAYDHIYLDVLLAREDSAACRALAHLPVEDARLVGRRLGYADYPPQVHIRQAGKLCGALLSVPHRQVISLLGEAVGIGERVADVVYGVHACARKLIEKLRCACRISQRNLKHIDYTEPYQLGCASAALLRAAILHHRLDVVLDGLVVLLRSTGR